MSSLPIPSIENLGALVVQHGRERQTLRNLARRLLSELVHNHEILRTIKPGADSVALAYDEYAELPFTPELLGPLLAEIRHEAYDTWLASHHNLERFGWIATDRQPVLSYWIFLTRLYNRCSYLQTRLRLAATLPSGRTVAVNEDLHLQRLARDFALAESHLHTWLYQSQALSRWWRRMRHSPLVKKRSVVPVRIKKGDQK